MIKTLKKAGIEGTYLNIIKAMYDKSTANIILNSEKLKAFPLKSGTRPRVPTFTTTIQHSFGSFSHSNQRRKRNKRNSDWKRSKTLFADGIILHIENPKDSTRKLLELMSEYIKVEGYKINTQKSLSFLYTSNEKTEKLRKQFHSPL